MYFTSGFFGRGLASPPHRRDPTLAIRVCGEPALYVLARRALHARDQNCNILCRDPTEFYISCPRTLESRPGGEVGATAEHGAAAGEPGGGGGAHDGGTGARGGGPQGGQSDCGGGPQEDGKHAA
eukprot:3116133-Pyramimonas_sp.AAC.1